MLDFRLSRFVDPLFTSFVIRKSSFSAKAEFWILLLDRGEPSFLR